MLPVISEEDLFNAYNVLFGSDNKMPIHVLRHLQPSVLNSAYRKKALESHPDRSKVLGENEAEMNERFIEITLAYEKLSSFMKGTPISVLADEIGIQVKGKERTARPIKKKDFSDHFYKGCIPKRRLLIGQFICYSGLISWRKLNEAIIWQKRQRPSIGQIALEWGILSSYDIKRILTERIQDRSYKEKFGEYARRKGYINSFELMALLGKQRELQHPIGEYFTEQGILYAREIDRMVEKLRIHNRCAFVGYGPKRAFPVSQPSKVVHPYGAGHWPQNLFYPA